jgi:hypothetical protein
MITTAAAAAAAAVHALSAPETVAAAAAVAAALIAETAAAVLLSTMHVGPFADIFTYLPHLQTPMAPDLEFQNHRCQKQTRD